MYWYWFIVQCMQAVYTVDNTAKNFLLELIFPSFCFGCKKEGSYLCQDCRAMLDIGTYTYCLCSKNPVRIPFDAAQGKPLGKCSRCRDKILSGLYFALPYKEKFLTRALIHHFKYEPYVKSLSGALGSILIEHFVLSGNNADTVWDRAVLTYVPSENSSLKSRGYNQSHELANELSQTIKIPVISNNLVKIRKTKPQMKLSAKERQENLKGAFAIKNPAEFTGKKVFLVDDVYTTGATMAECAKTLRAAGAQQVWGIAVAREG